MIMCVRGNCGELLNRSACTVCKLKEALGIFRMHQRTSRPWQNRTINLGQHYMLKPVCLNTMVTYGNKWSVFLSISDICCRWQSETVDQPDHVFVHFNNMAVYCYKNNSPYLLAISMTIERDNRQSERIALRMSRNVRERILAHVLPVKIQISLRVRAVWSESSFGAFWIAKDAKFLHADNEDSDQTAQVRRLIWVFFGYMQ